MIINSISLKNFQCYYGEHIKNTFKFEEGLNLIIGNNGGGKSKLFDAFFWVLYDQVFDSLKRNFVYTKEFKEKLISDKAKNLCDVGNKVSVEVIMHASSISQDKEYRLTRIFKVLRKDDDVWACDDVSIFLIDEKKVSRWQPVPNSKHESIINMVIPEHLKKFMWFQGEQVDSLMNLTDKVALTNIINLISNIQFYDELFSIIEKGESKASKDYRKAQGKLIKDQGKSDELNKRLLSVRQNIDKTKLSFESDKRNLSTAKEYIEELIGLIDDATKIAEIKKKKESLDDDVEKNNKKLTKIYNRLHKKMFNNYWVLRQAQPYFDKFTKKYNDYFNAHSIKANKANEVIVKLPINIPQPIHVNQMLEEESCFVCGRDAKLGSEEYQHIKALLERDEVIEESLFKIDCSKYFNGLYSNGLGYSKSIEKIDENISDVFEEIQDLRNNINSSRAELNDISSKFGEYLNDEQSDNIVQSFRIHESRRDQYQALVSDGERNLDELNTLAKQIESELDELVKGSGSKIDSFVDKAYSVFTDLLSITDDVKGSVFSELIDELETKANSLFKMMTRDNKSITGNIKINCSSFGHCIAEIVTKDGVVLSNPNDSNLVLVKLSLIMAIIQSRGKWSDNYSFITDAPTSKMAMEYSNGFYKTIGKNFTQSIVTTYDFVNDEERKIFTELNVRKAYVLEPNYPQGDKDNTTDLDIVVTEIR